MPRLQDKYALITGGGTGIGKAIARAFAAEGCTLALGARNLERVQRAADEIANEFQVTTFAYGLDVTQPAQVTAFFGETMQRFKRLDLVVNNAGAFTGAPFDEITDEMWQHVLGVNLNGVFYGTREAFKIMKKQGGGRIINIGSIAGIRPREHSAPYSTSKSGVIGLTNAAALDGREFGITVCALHPGNTLVERRADGHSLTGRDLGSETMIPAEDIAQAALLMATLPPTTTMLEAIVMPAQQHYLGRG